ncbi:MAG TPA: hypothetical protein VKA46_17275 [Gemmataceae bacterium]|nr:hypothetical protein [Gemmataceae bacterium]
MQLARFLSGRRLAALALLFLAFSVTGCAKTGKVMGKVTFDGKPLLAGKVNFIGEKSSEPAEIVDGDFTVNAPLGPCKVTVDTSYLEAMIIAAKMQGGDAPPGGPQMSDEDKKKLREKQQAGGDPKEKLQEGKEEMKKLMEKYRELPMKYNEPDKSGLSLTVVKGTQTFDINLVKPEGWAPGQRRVPPGGAQPGPGPGGGMAPGGR